MLEIVAGWEFREATGDNLCAFSATRRTSKPLRITPLIEKPLRHAGLYTRLHEERDGQLWDLISDAPMATTFANSRFLTPFLATPEAEFVLFCDFADMLFLADPAELFALASEDHAIQVVKHHYTPAELKKMDGRAQTTYLRKNWSSVILWNLTHPANARLTVEMVNTLPGRELHRFCWLEDEEIGELPLEWNYLVGVEPDVTQTGVRPKLLHFTLGLPTMPGYENGPYADVWKHELAIMDATRGRIEYVPRGQA